MRSRFVLLSCVSIGMLRSQQIPISGPEEGFTFDSPTKSLRPVVGALGSATLGKPILAGLAFGSVAPRRNYALTFQDFRCSVISGLGKAPTSTVRIPGSFLLPEGVAWSGDGSTAILYSRTGNWIQILSGLPSSPQAGSSLSLLSLAGSLLAVAADLHGEHIAIGMAGQGVYQIANAASFVPILSFSKPVALAFSDSGTLFGIDGATNQVFAQNMTNLSFQAWTLGSLQDPIALRPAHDGSNRAVIYVAGGGDRMLLAFDPSTHAVVASQPLNFQPNAIDPLGTNSFILESRVVSGDVLWSFRNTPQPSVYFVPATPVQARENRRP